ncbi:MAG: alpha/beta hydrolase [Bacteroidia bacterium]|nr:alpha/beta hydrolase [Bacteroidia bacterium]
MPRLTYTFLLSLVLLMVTGCYREETFEGQYADEYYIRHKGADLPVWVRGNRQSKSFIVFIHGGPGGSSLRTALGRGLRDLSDAHPIVFFDQRLSGYAHGERQADNLSIDQMTEDLDVVIRFIQQTYNPDHIFLMGHSWGGFLGTAYLINPTYRARISGWIEAAGAHNFPLTWEAERAYVQPIAEARVAAGEKTEYWQSFLDWNDTITALTSLEDLLFVNGFAQVADGKPGATTAYENPPVFWQLTAPVPLGSSQKLILDALQEVLIRDDLAPYMSDITTPALLIYGAYDAVVPKVLAQDAYDKLGTPASDKSIVIMPQEGHGMWEVEPAVFAGHVRDFIARYE